MTSLFYNSTSSCSSTPRMLSPVASRYFVRGPLSTGHFSGVLKGVSLSFLTGHRGEKSASGLMARDVGFQSNCFHKGKTGLSSDSSQGLVLRSVQFVKLGPLDPRLPTRCWVVEHTLLCRKKHFPEMLRSPPDVGGTKNSQRPTPFLHSLRHLVLMYG